MEGEFVFPMASYRELIRSSTIAETWALKESRHKSLPRVIPGESFRVIDVYPISECHKERKQRIPSGMESSEIPLKKDKLKWVVKEKIIFAFSLQ